MQDSQQAPAIEPLLITMEEAARRLSVGRTLIYEQVRRGKLPSIRVGRCRRIALVDLERYIEHLRENASQHTFRYPR